MTKNIRIEELRDNMYVLGEYICEVSNVGEDDTGSDSRHIKAMYKMIDEIDNFLATIMSDLQTLKSNSEATGAILKKYKQPKNLYNGKDKEQLL
jgi:hypothetical protein